MLEHGYKTSQEKCDKALEMMRVARINMIQGGDKSQPFYAALALNLQLKVAPIGTMATNGVDLIFDPEFVMGADPLFLKQHEDWVKSLEDAGVISHDETDNMKVQRSKFFAKKSIEELVFVITHEVRHCVNEHMIRGKHLDHSLFNKAGDYNINNRLAFELYGGIEQAKRSLPIFHSCLHDEKYCSHNSDKSSYEEWISEAIYQDLLKEQQENEKNGKQSGSGIGKGSFDQHAEISEEQAEKLKDVVIAAAQQSGDKCPSDVRKLVNDWTKPQIKWHNLLDRSLKNQNIHDYDYSNPHTRSWVVTDSLRQSGMITNNQYYVQPSYTREQTIEVCVWIDTSGSISDEVKRQFLGECSGVLKQFNNVKLHLACWGTEVINYQVIDHAGLSDLKTYKLHDGGGTQLECVADFIEKEKINCMNQVILTDGHFFGEDPTPRFKKFKNTILVIFGNPDYTSNHGRVVHYEV